MYNYLIMANIVISYALWVAVTLVLYDKIKNKFIYLMFPTFLYAVPLLFSSMLVREEFFMLDY
jgi:hypothetical protein